MGLTRICWPASRRTIPIIYRRSVTLRILLVDDEKPMVEILRRYLKPMASKIDDSNDLMEALEMAKTGNYTVVILDLRMRRTDKEESLHAVREFKSHNAAVVIVSGIPDPDLKDEVMAAGADAFLPKDGTFSSRALLLATNIATLKLPKGAYQSDSYLNHVELLHRMVTEL